MLIIAAAVCICILGSASILLLTYKALNQIPQHRMM